MKRGNFCHVLLFNICLFKILRNMSKIDTIQVSGSTYDISDANLGGFTLVKVTQQQYDQLQTKDPNTLYIIVN